MDTLYEKVKNVEELLEKMEIPSTKRAFHDTSSSILAFDLIRKLGPETSFGANGGVSLEYNHNGSDDQSSESEASTKHPSTKLIFNY